MSGAPGPGPGRSPLPCAPRPAAVLQLGGGAEPARPGVAVIDLRFPRGAAADVQEIVFRNFYTAFLSVRVQRPGPAGSRRWVTCLRDYCLMPCPHTEEGSQDYFSLRRHQMLCDVDQVTAVRFILRQPSPVWLHFTIEELQIFPPGPKVGSKLQHTAWCEGWRWDWGHPSCDPLDLFQSPQKDFPSWLSQLTPPEQPASLHGELPDPEKVSTEVQQMWVLTEVIRARQAAARIGRFDVDGCYDINLLSYT
ncbi:nicolin-1 isoform X1 [Rissa tridactyla]|uniref:nicolin-1 isoform X1 n=1 Tax=Rissa tridactyla TaxID=75485 RepID=UPI0023BA9719|nr:nicolin-1 isoform X1 [Rissa tridactyla]